MLATHRRYVAVGTSFGLVLVFDRPSEPSEQVLLVTLGEAAAPAAGALGGATLPLPLPLPLPLTLTLTLTLALTLTLTLTLTR